MAESEFETDSERLPRRPSSWTSRHGEPYERSIWSSPARSQRGDDGNPDDSDLVQARRQARALGWFSIGLGITEVVAPGAVARLAGINGNHALVRALGAREIGHGVGILSGRRPVGWLWSRVFGDVVDLAVLGSAAASPQSNRLRIVAAAAAITGVALLDFKTSRQLTAVADSMEEDDAIHVAKTIMINRPAGEIYRFWRDFKNLPRVMTHLESVEVIDDKRSRWTAKGPAGKRVEWDAETTADKPNELIAWRSTAGATVENAGSVSFEPATGGRGTFVRVELDYRPPAGRLGATLAKLFGEEPRLQIDDDLRRVKQLMETGEIMTTEGQPAGRAQSKSWKYDRVARSLATGF